MPKKQFQITQSERELQPQKQIRRSHRRATSAKSKHTDQRRATAADPNHGNRLAGLGDAGIALAKHARLDLEPLRVAGDGLVGRAWRSCRRAGSSHTRPRAPTPPPSAAASPPQAAAAAVVADHGELVLGTPAFPGHHGVPRHRIRPHRL